MTSVSISPPISQHGDRGHTQPGAAARTGDVAVLIVDDQRVARSAVWMMLGCQRQIRVIATAESSNDALSLANEHKPQACVVSATLDDWPGLARRLKQIDGPPRMLIYDAAEDARVIGAAIIAGADGTLRRDARPEELADVIRRVTSGAMLFPSLKPGEFRELLDCVDDHDRAIVAMLLERAHPDHIAGILGLSAHALRRRRQAILQQLNALRTSDANRRHPRSEPHA